jgi:DNA polymerase
MEHLLQPAHLLQFYVDIGADEAVGDAPVDRTKTAEKSVVLPATFSAHPDSTDPEDNKFPPPPGTIEAMGEAIALAASAKTLEELKAALENFEGLALKRTATQIVFADGNPAARVMIIGDTPGADEDRIGRPFAGAGGHLLDRMFSSIGLSRENDLYISTLINWRPPGNRAASEAEIALSLPFLQRHIALVAPAVLILMGGVPAKALLQTGQSITRLRGRWTEYEAEGLAQPVSTLVLFHPDYLLRSPAQKALAWTDLLNLKKKLKHSGL